MMTEQFPIQSFDERRNIMVPGNYQSTVETATRHILHEAAKAISIRGKFTWALSGGSTPKAVYQCIATEPYRNSIDWTKVWLFWSDERCVPPDHSESNYRMAMDAGMAGLGIPPSQIFRMRAEEQLFEHTADYEEILKSQCEDGHLDLVMLGMGEDGHTASLFPYTHGLNSREQLVTANYIPKLEAWRMSFTFQTLDLARHAVIYALGASKGPMIAEALSAPYDPIRLPIQRIGQPERHALWVLDEAAAEPLLNKVSNS